MADEPASKDAEAPAKRRKSAAPAPAEDAPASPSPKKKKSEGPKAPRRPTLDPETRRLMAERADKARRRPRFVRTASGRYWRIGRWESWRRPKGLQSKQRRHYGYRPRIVRIGFGSPARTRGRTPTGFEPVLVRTPVDIERLEASQQAAIIARTVGTRRRLVLEEVCRKRGIHILNPIVKEREEST